MGREQIGKAAGRLRAVGAGYAGDSERPLGSYGGILAAYASMTALLGMRARHRLPERVAAGDLALMTVAVFRASRLVTKDSVTAVARAPFTEFEAPAGEGEVTEAVAGRGLRHAVGELVTCPFCVAVWLSTVIAFGLVLAPRATRLACAILTAVTGSDLLQFGYSAVRAREQRGG
ncbi:MAG TPA: DUF1360 domain-containing protein [Acidimicrobiales bacterium]|nr:DUF1360 domain-containing protein [Acidimicrobiales bacterium]